VTRLAGILRQCSPFAARRHSKTAPGALRSRLHLEPLEERALLTVSQSGDVLNITGDFDYLNESDVINIIRDSGDPSLIDVELNGDSFGPFDDVNQINVRGFGGNDVLTLDSTNGLLNVPRGIFYDGGSGFDRLNLLQSGGPTQIVDSYSVGPNNGEGTSSISGAGGTQTVTFENIEPVFDIVPAATLNVTATNSDNAINYSQGGAATNGEVTIDNQELIQFSNKTALNLIGLNGSDTFNLNNSSTPTGLTSITVNGGDPTAGSDTLIVNGTAGADTITYRPNGIDSGSVTVNALPAISFNTIEDLIVNGRGGGDALTVDSTVIDGTLVLTPGSTFDSGRLDFAVDTASFSLAPALQFLGLGSGGSFSLLDTGDTFDDFIYRGTDLSDRFTVTHVNVTTDRIALNNRLPVNISQVLTLTLAGLEGDDVFNLPGNTVVTGIIVDGGGPSASDIVHLTGATGAVTVSLADSALSPPTNTVVSGYGVPVTLIGVEVANLDANSNALSAVGTSRNDSIIYTPTDLNAGTFQEASINTVFNFTGVTGAFTVFGGLGLLADTLTIRGSNIRDAFVINAAARTAQLGATKTVTLNNSVEVLNAEGLAGDDTFEVAPAVGPGFSLQNLLINIDGGDPQASDALVITAPGGGVMPASQFVFINKGRNPDSGTVRVIDAGTIFPDVSYRNVEVVSANVAGGGLSPNLVVLGPDMNEPNEFLGTATFLGSGPNLQIQHASIYPSSGISGVAPDQDFYRVVADKTGTLDFQVYFRRLDPAIIAGAGTLLIQVLDSAGAVIGAAGVGSAQIFGASAPAGDARVRIPAVAGQNYYLRVVGITTDGPFSPVINEYDATIINTPAPQPFDLALSRSVPAPIAGNPDTGDLPTDAINSDSGRTQFDNTTFSNLPTIYLRLNDGTLLNDLPGNDTPDSPPAGVIPIPFQGPGATPNPGYRVAIFDGNNSQTPVGFATQVPGFPGLYTYTFTTPLADGLHHINAAVQMVDPRIGTHQTGFGAFSLHSLELIVDTVPPPVTFTGIHPSSDSGVLGDEITNDTTPLFFGTAEANAIIRLFVQVPGPEGPVNVPIGLTVAIPLDGTNAFPNGSWGLVSTVDLNDPILGLPIDGVRHLFVTAEDLAGNVSDEVAFDIFLDTQGPQVTGVFITDVPDYNLFGLKPNNAPQGPTPLINSLTIDLQDLPERDAAFLYNAINAGIASTPGVITLRGDQNGLIAISQIIVTNDPPVAGEVATASIELVFAQPLPDDRFTLIVSDAITDLAGNHLDGESNASEPQNLPHFPSGDGVPGGSFIARFTVDTRPEIGFYAGLNVIADINGNGFLDYANADATNRDLAFRFGEVSDQRFAGKLSPGLLPGFDVLAAYGNLNGSYRFLVDFNGNGAFDAGESITSPVQVTALAVAGDFDKASPGDEVALFTGTTWYILSPGLGGVATSFAGASAGYPLAGDFDGDGNEDLATYQNDQFYFDFGPSFGGVGAQISFGAPGAKDRPVAADMDFDGIDDIGLWIPNTGTDQGTTEWRFLLSNDFNHAFQIPGTVNTLSHPFAPVPLGHDIAFHFGDQTALPIVGNFDPPIAAPAVAQNSTTGPGAGSTSGSTTGTSSQTTPTLAQNQKIVASLYQDILGRAPDQSGLNHYTSQLAAGVTRAAVAQSLLTSAERLGEIVDQFYDTYLHRKADAAGRAYYVGMLLNGGTEDAVATSFMLSTEYAALHVGDAEFVKALYRDILGRAPDATGQAAHLATLASGKTRAQVVATFLSSDERYHRIVDQLYGQYFQRHADLTGMAWYASKLKTGEQTVRSLSQTLIAADEYFAQL
jgi:hypothetical protein